MIFLFATCCDHERFCDLCQCYCLLVICMYRVLRFDSRFHRIVLQNMSISMDPSSPGVSGNFSIVRTFILSGLFLLVLNVSIDVIQTLHRRMARAKPRTQHRRMARAKPRTQHRRMARAKPRTQPRHFRRMARAKPRTQHRRMARAKPRTQHRRMARAKPRTQLRHFRRMARAKPRTHFVLAGAKPSTPLQGLTVAFWSVDGVCFLRFWFELLTSVLLMGFASISFAPFGGRVCVNT